mgnify:CR=1 FL=1
MEKNVDHESKRDLLYVIVIIILAIIYAGSAREEL